jgi:hypothetical protein
MCRGRLERGNSVGEHNSTTPSAGVAGAELSWATCADRREKGKAGWLAANGPRPVLGVGEKGEKGLGWL